MSNSNLLDLGHPWGRVYVPRGYEAVVVPAACADEDHSNHPACDPYWRDELPAGSVVRQVTLVDEGWRALVLIPKAVRNADEIVTAVRRLADRAAGDCEVVLDDDDLAVGEVVRDMAPVLDVLDPAAVAYAWKAWADRRYQGTVVTCEPDSHSVTTFLKSVRSS